MSKSEFDLIKKIREYNEKYQKNIDELTNFGCKSLSRELLQSLQSALLWVHIGNFKEEYTKTRFSNPALKALEAFDKLKIIPHKNDTQDLIAARNFYYWKKRWKEKFNDEVFWEQILEKNERRHRLIDLQKKWSYFDEYSTYSQNELVYIIKKIIPAGVRYIDYAELEVAKNRKNIPEPIYLDLIEHLQTIKQDLQQSKLKISNTMRQQLLLCFEDKNHQFDIISYYLKVMQVMSNELVELPNFLLPKHTFDMELLPDYLDGIMLSSSIENLSPIQNKLKKINCQIFKTALGWQIIPVELKMYIPSKIPFYRIFAIGDTFRSEFFRFKSKLLLSIHDAPDLRALDITTSTAEKINLAVNTIIDLGKFCQDDMLETDRCSYRGLFFRKTQKFLNSWKHWINNHYIDYVEQKIQFAERLVISIRGCQRNQDSPEDNVVSSILQWNKVATLKTLLDSLGQDKLRADQLQRFTILKTGWSKFQDYMLAFQLINEISAGKHNLENLLKLTTIFSIIRVKNSAAAGVFVSFFREKFHDLGQDYLAFIKHHPFDYQDLSQAENDLKRNHQIMLLMFEVIKIPDAPIRDQMMGAMDRKFYKYIINYYEGLIWFSNLNVSGKISSEIKNKLNDYFLLLEDHILKMADFLDIHNLYGKHPLQELFNEIVQHRKNEDWANLACVGKKALFFIMKDQKFAEKRFERDYAVFSERLSLAVEDKSAHGLTRSDPGSFRKILKKLHLKINLDFKKTKYKNTFDNPDEIMPLLEACQKARQAKEKLTGNNDYGQTLARELEATLLKSRYIEDSENILLKNSNNNSLCSTKFFDKKYVNANYQSPLSLNL